MKRLIFLLFFIPVICSGQAVYVSFQPADFGFGLRSDYRIFYSSFSYGNGGLYRQYDLKHYIKVTAGMMIPLKPYHGWKYFPTVGINYHIISKPKYKTDFFTHGNKLLNPRIRNPLSFEWGLTIHMGHFALGMRTDILRWEPCIDLGYNFKIKDKKRIW